MKYSWFIVSEIRSEIILLWDSPSQDYIKAWLDWCLWWFHPLRLSFSSDSMVLWSVHKYYWTCLLETFDPAIIILLRIFHHLLCSCHNTPVVCSHIGYLWWGVSPKKYLCFRSTSTCFLLKKYPPDTPFFPHAPFLYILNLLRRGWFPRRIRQWSQAQQRKFETWRKHGADMIVKNS